MTVVRRPSAPLRRQPLQPRGIGGRGSRQREEISPHASNRVNVFFSDPWRIGAVAYVSLLQRRRRGKLLFRDRSEGSEILGRGLGYLLWRCPWDCLGEAGCAIDPMLRPLMGVDLGCGDLG